MNFFILADDTGRQNLLNVALLLICAVSTAHCFKCDSTGNVCTQKCKYVQFGGTGNLAVTCEVLAPGYTTGVKKIIGAEAICFSTPSPVTDVYVKCSDFPAGCDGILTTAAGRTGGKGGKTAGGGVASILAMLACNTK